jgi:NADP-dependent 3-hydroxy acid dehydrogenase YdfG
MSKFAAVALAHALRRSGFAQGIRATAICPSLVATDMTADLSDVPRERMTQPEDVARIVRTVVELPSTASVAEVPITFAMEDTY